MKTLKLVAMAALVSTSFTAAFADTIPTPSAGGASTATETAMQTQCDAAALLRGPATGDNDHYTGTVVPGGSTLVAGPTEVGGTRVIDQSTVVGTGTYVPSQLEIRGNPMKNGGSVNMFGDQWSTRGYYPDSTYTYTADFTSTFAYAYSCDINKAVYHPAVYHPAVHHDQVGHWVVSPDAHGNEEANTNNCNAFNTSQPGGPPQGGNTLANCLYIVDTPASDDPASTDPATWDTPTVIANDPETAINQDQTDSLTAFEDHGGIVYTTGEYHVGQPVICISPGSKGGSWKAQNGYSGGSFTNTNPATPGCNTNWFKATTWFGGSQTSNGTFISVPGYHY